MAAYTTIDDPEAYFQVKTYTGNGTDDTAHTFDGDTDMQPDLVWIKNRDEADDHCVFDSIRGATIHLPMNSTGGESTDADTLDSFTSDGFQVDADVKVNTNTEKYVAWCWKESAVSGFDMVGYTGNGSAATVSHYLSAVPHLYIIRKRSGDTWMVYHHKNTDDPETDFLPLNDDEGTRDSNTRFNDTAPTSSVFSRGSDGGVCADGETFITYLFSEKQGFSKFGHFNVASGDADGPFCYCGFRPAFIMVKSIVDGTNWCIVDNKRTPTNPCNEWSKANDSAAVFGPTNKGVGWDLLSNGFKVRNYNGDFNDTSYDPYVWIAFAESPFVNSNGVPNNAR